ncbi:MAG: hypothetical protein FJY54_14365 [Betaproteobacteria bacterium]|nr:hypothetical protein [Betaproteobacteria bacterium]
MASDASFEYSTDAEDQRVLTLVATALGLFGTVLGVANYLDTAPAWVIFFGVPGFIAAALCGTWEKIVVIHPEADRVEVRKGTFVHRGYWVGKISDLHGVGIVTVAVGGVFALDRRFNIRRC